MLPDCPKPPLSARTKFMLKLPVFFGRANAGNLGDQVLSKIFPGFEPSSYVFLETNNNHENWPISCQKRDLFNRI